MSERDDIRFDTEFDPCWGEPVEVRAGVARLTARNAGPMTFKGTNTYLLGETRLVVIDPGPADDGHFEALQRAIGARPVEAILLTHRHRDHTGLVDRLRRSTRAPVLAAPPRAVAPTDRSGATDDSPDDELLVDRYLADAETLATPAGTLEVVATPGHTADHLAFALAGPGILFSGDHVMAWSTTVVAPPEGSMAAFMASIERLLARETDRIYLPGHGGPVTRPQPFLRALRTHRRMREAGILERVRAGDGSVAEIVAALYRSLDPQLRGAAALSVLAHLEALCQAGLVRTDSEGAPRVDGLFWPA
ncbi:MBL fold metallo-hydrolase [Mangrovibrevibacter kandeliae]|uniref:MBL fold metallo-hydrolase n=1 Tax=Mangrovibrevibacter kandeliae TaxID=2968473 RepID=UPI002117E1E0|nr:MBL fold metallo-hydrolase [Aurantimonas sp. CSK15Z-1]MCQ8780753.1 MBL fold metallo-hydrolase [Aurantimonas sp. CSK15Z-1]